MKTFGELVTYIKHANAELCEELLRPGASHTLGPAFAYGRSFLIHQAIRTLHDAIQQQEMRLTALVDRETNPGSTQNNDTHLWRVTDSIHQSLSLIDKYMQDPSRYTQNSIAEWIKQESAKYGMVCSEGPNSFQVSGANFVIDVTLPSDITEPDAKLSYSFNGQDSEVSIPEFLNFFLEGNKEHISHLLSIQARLDIIEVEASNYPPIFTQSITGFSYRPSLGGVRFEMDPNFETLLTLDSFDQHRRAYTIVCDPPIPFPLDALKGLQTLCGLRLNIERSSSSSLSAMLDIPTETTRMLDEYGILLNLVDSHPLSIMVARIPLVSLEVFEGVANVLQRAAKWSTIIKETFNTNENVETKWAMQIAPQDDFTYLVSYWSDELPTTITVKILENCSLTTDSDALNSVLGSNPSFPEILSKLG